MCKYITAILLITILISACNKLPDKNKTVANNAVPAAQSGGQAEEKKDMSINVRESVLAGSWYPGNPKTLRESIEKYLSKVKLPEDAKSLDTGAIISPHAGHQYSGQCAAFGYSTVRGKPFKRVIIIGPSHYVGFFGISVTKATHYETPLGRVAVDRAACDALLKNERLFSYQKDADMQEHSVEIQLPFLQVVLSDFKIVPMVVGDIEDYTDYAMAIRKIVDEQTLVVASSDFTHYGYSHQYVPFTDNIKDNLYKLNQGAIEEIVNISPQGFEKYVNRTGATICGYKPILILLNMLGKKNADSTGSLRSLQEGVLLNYDTSSDIIYREEKEQEPKRDVRPDYSNCVCYASIGFSKDLLLSAPASKKEDSVDTDLTKSEQSFLLSLSRETLRSYLKDRKMPKPNEQEVTDRLREKRGLFVTLTEKGELRGCIGCMTGYSPLYQQVMEYTVNSAMNDSRFMPVETSEEKDIAIEISVLSPMKKVDSYEDIVIGKHGVYMMKDGHKGVFLPQVAPEQGWTRDEMLNHLSLDKAGLPMDAWRNGAEFLVFTAQVFGEHK